MIPLGHASWRDITIKVSEAPLIALVEDESPASYARAYAKRAVGVVAISWELERIVSAIVEAIDGFSVIPTGVAREMASRHSGPPTDVVLSAMEREALRMLCSGATVVRVADRLAYSEREMHRILGGLYERMGVGTRAEAIVRAVKWGITD